MIKLKSGRTVFCDVDDTIIIWDTTGHSLEDMIKVGDDDHTFYVNPHDLHIEFIKKLKAQGYTIVVWSAAGADWATHVVEKLKLQDIVDLVCDKPEFVLDDLPEAKQIIKSILYIDPVTGEFKRS